ncbi:MAG: NAD(P)/FAD-dependent oxidoreductase [Gemmatimonadales bacterium]
MAERRIPHVVIVGGGFAGLAAARALRKAPVEITLIDRTNHHVFQPLLDQVATAAVSPGDITAPIRWILRRQKNVRVLLGEVRGIDVRRRLVRLDVEPGEVEYDFLIVAAGARHSYFGHPEWESLAPGLKTVPDALEIRNRFLSAFERAERSTEPEERRDLLTFVVVGGGATGVELAGVLPVIARKALAREYRVIDTRDTRVILLEGGPRVLPAFPKALAEAAHRYLEELGVEVRTNSLVTRLESGSVYVGEGRIGTRTVFWAAGNEASSLGRSLDSPLDEAGRVLVEPDLSISDHPEVFVVGDLAALRQDGNWIPWVAPAAIQEGAHAAGNILRELKGEPRTPFHYRDKGMLAMIGRHKAVAHFGSVRMSGTAVWFLWLFLHILYLVGFRNRLSVLLQWAYAYFTYQRGVRLITRQDPGP